MLFNFRNFLGMGFAALPIFGFGLGWGAEGRQLTGPHAPSSDPACSVEVAETKFRLPEGFEARLFASEPMVVNPVGMSWDSRGRLWVVELFEYPMGAKPGEKPRDRVKVLEDTDGDGKADKMTVFAEGLNLATGILWGNGGVYVGQAPDLLFFKDTDGDDVADVREVLLTGFGLEDRHELLNGFTWGPDGWIYMTHGVFTHSKVRPVGVGEDDGVIMNAAVARFHPETKKFEIFADGTSNPWGVDFDRYGNAFVSACVIDHLFHLAPAGLYDRQAGAPEYPYSYGLLPSIVEHKHYRAAYAGIQIYQGHQYPEPYRGNIFMGSIHGNALVQDVLVQRGASFKAEAADDFLQSDDGWFRPVSVQTGPDGSLWVMDWYDKYPCYQNARADPEGVDREYGRIWRIVHTQGEAATKCSSPWNLSRNSISEWVNLLQHPNQWQRRMAQRMLSEAKNADSKPLLWNVLAEGKTEESRLAALWTLHGAGLLQESDLDAWAGDPSPGIRMWVARLTGESRSLREAALARLNHLASDPDPRVRLAVATAARQYVSAALTVNEALPPAYRNLPLGPILATLVQNSTQNEDPTLPFVIWMALEPYLMRNAQETMGWFLERGTSLSPLADQLVYKSIRRFLDSSEAVYIDLVGRFLEESTRRRAGWMEFALRGALDGQRGGVKKPSLDLNATFRDLMGWNQGGVPNLAMRLGALWGNEVASEKIVELVHSRNADAGVRLEAIRLLGQVKSDGATGALRKVLSEETSGDALAAAVQVASSAFGDPWVAEVLLGRWSNLPSSVKPIVAEAMAGRPQWLDPFLTRIEKGEVSRLEVPVSVIRNLSRHDSEAVRERARLAIGRFREPNQDKVKLIAQKKRLLARDGAVNWENGRKQAEMVCLTCHTLHGKGAAVGPDLTGVGRSDVDALLANVINPNQIIGRGYENVEVKMKDGRFLSGRLAEENAEWVKLLSAGPREEVLPRGDMESLTVSEVSVMPEGLEQLPDDDFRDLMWYILNPPEDQRPWSENLRVALLGEIPNAIAVDWESVSLWNPEWGVDAPEKEGTPKVLTDYAGGTRVLMTYPYGHQRAATLTRQVQVPSNGQLKLRFEVASQASARWVLRVFVAQKLVVKETIDGRKGVKWVPVEVDLAPFKGQTVEVKLENYAFSMENDFGYWRDLRLVTP